MKIEIISLTNKQLKFDPARNVTKHIIFYLAIFLAIYSCIYFLSLKVVSDPHILAGIIACFFIFLVSFLNFAAEGLGSKKLFEKGIDKFGKTREEKVKEFWGEVLASQEELKISRTKTYTENYSYSNINNLEKILTGDEVTLTWRNIDLYYYDRGKCQNTLEGFPSILKISE